MTDPKELLARFRAGLDGVTPRPMETAPDRGEVILLVKERAGVPGKYLVGHFMEGGFCIDDHPPIDRGWYFWNGSMFDRAAEPVGWFPLPGKVDQDLADLFDALEAVIAERDHANNKWDEVTLERDAAEAEAASLKAEVARLEGALERADVALGDYACHLGPFTPCLRTERQCATECGRVAGDALMAVRAALRAKKEVGE